MKINDGIRIGGRGIADDKGRWIFGAGAEVVLLVRLGKVAGANAAVI